LAAKMNHRTKTFLPIKFSEEEGTSGWAWPGQMHVNWLEEETNSWCFHIWERGVWWWRKQGYQARHLFEPQICPLTIVWYQCSIRLFFFTYGILSSSAGHVDYIK
jgi:hypothetical protein